MQASAFLLGSETSKKKCFKIFISAIKPEVVDAKKTYLDSIEDAKAGLAAEHQQPVQQPSQLLQLARTHGIPRHLVAGSLQFPLSDFDDRCLRRWPSFDYRTWRSSFDDRGWSNGRGGRRCPDELRRWCFGGRWWFAISLRRVMIGW